MKTKTFRSELLGHLLDVLKREGMTCADTAESLVELVVALSRYQEEGVNLYPRFVICDSLVNVLPVIQCTDSIFVGEGTRTVDTARLALKKCAPLSRGPWVGFIERGNPGFRFGVFRESISPISLGLRDTIFVLKDETTRESIPPLVLISPLADKVVEVLGARGEHLIVHLSAVTDDQPSPHDDTNKLVAAISLDVSTDNKEMVENFFRTSLSSALQRGHGALIVVTKSKTFSPELSDGVPFDIPIDLGTAVIEHATAASPETLGKLLAYAELIEGLLSTDGITVFSTNAMLLGYNTFVQQPHNVSTPPRALVGGARRRAFDVLCSFVDNTALYGVYMRSTDGAAKWHCGNK